MAKVAERPVDRKRPKWMSGIDSEWGTDDERHHGQTTSCGDEPHYQRATIRNALRNVILWRGAHLIAVVLGLWSWVFVLRAWYFVLWLFFEASSSKSKVPSSSTKV